MASIGAALRIGRFCEVILKPWTMVVLGAAAEDRVVLKGDLGGAPLLAAMM